MYLPERTLSSIDSGKPPKHHMFHEQDPCGTGEITINVAYGMGEVNRMDKELRPLIESEPAPWL
jgi:hypothetical protein